MALASFKETFKDKINNEPEYDVVNAPEHYCSGAHECIDVMEEMFGIQAVIDFCRCNIFKYRFRAAKKNGEEDIKKAEWYEDKLMALRKKQRLESHIHNDIISLC